MYTRKLSIQKSNYIKQNHQYESPCFTDTNTEVSKNKEIIIYESNRYCSPHDDLDRVIIDPLHTLLTALDKFCFGIMRFDEGCIRK